MQDGKFPDRSPQSLYFPMDRPQAGLFKGMRIIIQECIEHGANLPDPTKLLAECKNFKCAPGRSNCCCCRILFNQPDFISQKSKLEELGDLQGFKVIFNPKFHCELSFIEQCWGLAKRVYREYPVSSSEADLERNVAAALNSVPIASMRRSVNLFSEFLLTVYSTLEDFQTGHGVLWMLTQKASMEVRQHGRLASTEGTEFFLKPS
jgi:hypothetical protein